MRSNRQHISMVGEIGLDYKFAKTPEQRAVQRNLLDVQLRLAKELQLPVNLHSRRAERDVLRIATELTASGTHSLLHWFTHNKKFVAAAVSHRISF